MIPPRRRSRRPPAWVALLLTTALVVAGCTTSKPKARPAPKTPTTAATTPTPTVTPSLVASKIQFADCTTQIGAGLPRKSADRVNLLTFACGRIDVPLSYTDPYGPTTELYVVRVHYASQSSYQGDLMVNPGGPGESGVNLAVNLGLTISLDLLDHFDLIGFDPRGVFLSSPVQCISSTQKDQLTQADPDVRTSAGLARARAIYTGIDATCAKKYGDDLQVYNTEYTARDMDLVRQGVGDTTLNYLGYGYGARLGATYAHIFPGEVRTMVLDGPTDPGASELASAQSRTAALEKAFDQFAADCARRPACRPIGSVRATVTALVARANRVPIPTTKPGDRRRAGGGVVLSALQAAVFDQTQWTALGAAVISARHGDARGLFALSDAYTQRSDDGTYSNQFDTFTAVTCNDSTLRLSDIQIQARARTWAVTYPLFGASQAATLLRCQSWPATRHPIPPATTATSAPIVVIGTVHDPAVPYAGAAALARTLKSGHLVTWAGTGPTAYPRTTCLTKVVDRYLIDATAPAPAATCPAQ